VEKMKLRYLLAGMFVIFVVLVVCANMQAPAVDTAKVDSGIALREGQRVRITLRECGIRFAIPRENTRTGVVRLAWEDTYRTVPFGEYRIVHEFGFPEYGALVPYSRESDNDQIARCFDQNRPEALGSVWYGYVIFDQNGIGGDDVALINDMLGQ
jgi:hypothetical protein